MTRQLLALIACLGILFMSAGSARAGGFDYDQARFGSERGHAATPTPLAVYYNPAALAATRGVHLAVDLNIGYHRATYDRTAATVAPPQDASSANLGTDKVSNLLAAPTLAASLRYKDFSAGVGLFAPFGGQLQWQGNSAYRDNLKYPGAQDGTARWHIINGSLAVLYLSAAAAYTVRPIRLTLGLSGNAIYSKIDYTRAQTAQLDDNLATEGRAYVNVHGVLGSFGAGAMWEAIENKLWLALSYQAPPGLHGGMRLTGDAKTNFGGNIGDVKSVVRQNFADAFRWAVRFKPTERYELRLFGDWQRWSLLKNQCLSARGSGCPVEADGSLTPGSKANVVSNMIMNWRDTFTVRAGASYWLTPAWETFVGLGFISNAVPSSTLSPLVIDGNTIQAAGGARVTMNDHGALLFSYTQLQMLARTAHSRLDTYKFPSRLPTSSGHYTQWAGVLNVLYELTF